MKIKPKHKLILAGVVFFMLINIFEALQQQYYINRYNLAPTETISYLALLRNHLLRWTVWSLIAIPLIIFVRKHRITDESFSISILLKYAILTGILLTATLVLISIVQLLVSNDSWSSFPEYLLFFTFQKAAWFFTAYIGLIMLLHVFANLSDLNKKTYELATLRKRYNSLYLELNSRREEEGTNLINVKIGNKVKLLPLSEIEWIQSDDYCVKIHTSDGRHYHLRQTMNELEHKLSAKGFLRVHRTSIVNIRKVEYFRFHKQPQVRLKRGHTLKIAAGRIPKIRAYIDAHV